MLDIFYEKLTVYPVVLVEGAQSAIKHDAWLLGENETWIRINVMGKRQETCEIK